MRVPKFAEQLEPGSLAEAIFFEQNKVSIWRNTPGAAKLDWAATIRKRNEIAETIRREWAARGKDETQ